MSILSRKIQNRTNVNFSIERAIATAEDVLSGKITRTIIYEKEIYDLANGVLALYAQIKKEYPTKEKKPGVICEVCKTNDADIICAVPMVPISCAYCCECFDANAHPWAIMVSNTACMDGMEHTNADWKRMVEDTCKHLGKTIEEFNSQVEQEIKQMEIAWQIKGTSKE